MDFVVLRQTGASEYKLQLYRTECHEFLSTRGTSEMPKKYEMSAFYSIKWILYDFLTLFRILNAFI